MHFRIKRLKLLNALAKATRAVSVRSPLPVLTGIKFDLQAHQLVLTGSDSDITIQTIVDEDDDLEILKEGSVVLNSRYILDIVRKINSDDIEIEIIDGLLTRIKGSQIEFNLNGTDAIEYPRIDLSKTGTHFMMNALALKNIISETKFAASDKETRPILTGINFKAHDHVLEVVATDSYRLAKKIISIDEDMKIKGTSNFEGLKFKEIRYVDIINKEKKLIGVLEDLIIDKQNFEIKGIIMSSGIFDKMLKGKEVITLKHCTLCDEYILYNGNSRVKLKTLPHNLGGDSDAQKV